MNRVRELRYEHGQGSLDGVGGTREAENEPALRYTGGRSGEHRGRPDLLEAPAAQQLSEPVELLLEVRSNCLDRYVSLGETCPPDVHQDVGVALHEPVKSTLEHPCIIRYQSPSLDGVSACFDDLLRDVPRLVGRILSPSLIPTAAYRQEVEPKPLLRLLTVKLRRFQLLSSPS